MSYLTYWSRLLPAVAASSTLARAELPRLGLFFSYSFSYSKKKGAAKPLISFSASPLYPSLPASKAKNISKIIV